MYQKEIQIGQGIQNSFSGKCECHECTQARYAMHQQNTIGAQVSERFGKLQQCGKAALEG